MNFKKGEVLFFNKPLGWSILIAILPVTVLVMAAAGRTTQALTARNKKEEADHD